MLSEKGLQTLFLNQDFKVAQGPQEVVSVERYTYLNKVADALRVHAQEIGIPGTGDFVFYGSMVNGSEKPGSDIDMLYVYEGEGGARRSDTTYDNRRVSFYHLPIGEYRADGSTRKYGGYFSMKTFNPHVVIGGDLANEIIPLTVGEFIGPFAREVASRSQEMSFNAEQLTAQAVKAYMRLCPPYIGYFDELVASPNIASLWAHMTGVVEKGFLAAGIVREEKGLYRYEDLPFDFVGESWKAISAFSAFGAVEHGNDFTWPSRYYKLGTQKLTKTNADKGEDI